MDTNTILVSGYTRTKKTQKPTTQSIDPVTLLLFLITGVTAAIYFWYITVLAGILCAAWYTSTRKPKHVAPMGEPEVPEMKGKRGYHKRLIINHFQHGTVKV